MEIKNTCPKLCTLKTPLIKKMNLEEGEENAAVAIHGTSAVLDTQHVLGDVNT